MEFVHLFDFLKKIRIRKNQLQVYPDTHLIKPIKSAILEYNEERDVFEADIPICFHNRGQLEGVIFPHEIFPEPIGNFSVEHSLSSESESTSPKVFHIGPGSIKILTIKIRIGHQLDREVIDEIDHNITLHLTMNKLALKSRLRFFRRNIQFVKKQYEIPLRLVLTNTEYDKAISDL